MPISRTHWTPPMDGFYKVNVALCCLSSPCKAGSGILVQDHGGNVIATRCLPLSYSDNKDQTELKSLKDAMEFAYDIGLSSVILEHEFPWLHKELVRDSSWSAWGQVVEDMKILLRRFSSWKSNLCLPVANKPSRALARYAHAFDEAIVWMEDNPPIIASLVSRDTHSL